MASNRNKRKLSSKQANIISLTISAMYFICGFISGVISKPTKEYEVMYWGIGCVVGTALIYMFFYCFIFKVEDKKAEEKRKKDEFVTMQYLSYTEYKKVYFLPKVYGMEITMMRKILQKEGCTFYAKITENKNIYLIAKDKHDEVVFESEIDSYYFNSSFKIEE